jgi:uncharacterized lipoprotein YajG
MSPYRTFRKALILPLLALLTGCVAGQTLDFGHTPAQSPQVGKNVSVIVSVKDNRPYIVNGEKGPSFIGIYRGGFGNTFDVKTGSKQPFAGDVKRDLSADLKALGFNVSEAAGSARQVQVVINEWKFDTYTSGTFWCDIDVAVLDNTNRVLAKHKIKDEAKIEGSVWVGAKGAMEREMPKIYSGIINKMVRNNTQALRSLQP